MSGLTLYSLADQYRELERLSDPDVPEEAIRDTLEALTGDIQIKARNVAAYAQHLEALQMAADAAAEQMQQRAKRIGRRVAAMHEYLKVNMEACGLTKIECAEFTLSVVKNPPAVIIDDEAQIPEQYMVTPEPPPPPSKRPDKKALAVALKSAEVPGAHLQNSTRLKVKI